MARDVEDVRLVVQALGLLGRLSVLAELPGHRVFGDDHRSDTIVGTCVS
jgi:hypothetical protein